MPRPISVPSHGLGDPAFGHRAADAGESARRDHRRDDREEDRQQPRASAISAATATDDVRDSFSYENGNSVNTPEWSPCALLSAPVRHRLPEPECGGIQAGSEGDGAQERAVGRDGREQVAQQAARRGRPRSASISTSRACAISSAVSTCSSPSRGPIAACHPPSKPPEDMPAGLDADLVAKRHRMMTDLMLMAVRLRSDARLQHALRGRVLGDDQAGLRQPHHTATHEEAVVETEHCQPNVSWYTKRAMEEWAYYVQRARQHQGRRRLDARQRVHLRHDRSVVREDPRHRCIPMFSAGSAQGRVEDRSAHRRRGLAGGTRLGYTAHAPRWASTCRRGGDQSNHTSKEIGKSWHESSFSSASAVRALCWRALSLAAVRCQFSERRHRRG